MPPRKKTARTDPITREQHELALDRQRDRMRREHAEQLNDYRQRGEMDGRAEALADVRKALGILTKDEIEYLIEDRVSTILNERGL